MLYLHVPFCVRKCHYCDFLSGPFSPEVRRGYVNALKKEISVRCAELAGRRASSIFFGGGTPSLLEPEELESLMGAFRKELEVLPDAEITIECNPGTTSQDKLKAYRELGFNRLSFGVQSADPKELALLGRIHTWEDFLESYEQARKAGFININLDLISALPGQTMESWMHTLESALALQPMPEHLSAYSLILEEGTKFAEWERQGKFRGELEIPSEELDREMAHATLERLQKAGFERYEISNFAREGHACRHNCGYWTRKDYLGLGLGAASLLGTCRYANETDLQRYLEDPLAGRKEQKLTRQEEMEETIFLGLRMTKGVSRQEFRRLYDISLEEAYGDVLEKNGRDGLLIADDLGIRLTERGMDLSNYVMAQFLR